MADSIFISLPAIGDRAQLDDQVFMSFYGPRGGSRATEIITIETAAKLRDELVEKLGGGLQADMVAALSIAHEALLAAASDVLDNPNRKGGEYARLMSAKEHVERAIGKTPKRYAGPIDVPAPGAVDAGTHATTAALDEGNNG